MRCTSCGYDIRNGKVCTSCGYDHRENPINAPTIASNGRIRITKSEPQISRKPSRTGTYSVCTSCGYQLKNSMMCPSCGHDNRNSKSELQIDSLRKSGYTEEELLLRRWLGFLFWLIIPSIIGSLMSKSESLALVGSLITVLTNLAYGLILMRLSEVEENYRTAGIFCLVSMGLALLSVMGVSVTLIVTIPALVISLMALYYEYCGHSYVLAEVDSGLSEAWNQLWKWTIGVYIGMICGALLVFISLYLASVIVLLASIGVIIVSIVKLVFLYKTAESF